MKLTKSILNTWINHPYFKLILVLITGFIFRLWFIFNSDHIYHPDEIFQTLEPAHKLVFGYGLIPWDYTYGLRSFFVPLLLSIPLLLSKLFGTDDPYHYLLIIKLFLIICSLILIPFTYKMVMQISRSRQMALLSAFTSAIWYELIYFSPRALTETISIYLYALAFCLRTQSRALQCIYMFLITIALMIRPQYFPLYLLLVWLRFSTRLKSAIKVMFLGVSVAVCVVGLADLYFYHAFLVSLFRNIMVSYSSGISSLFGTEPFSFYLYGLLTTSFGLVLTLPFAVNYPSSKPFVSTYAAILLLHSLIPHKEYRFIFSLIALGLPLMILGGYQLLNHLKPSVPKNIKLYFIAVLISLVSFFGIQGDLPNQSRLYLQEPLYKDPILGLLVKLPDIGPCGLATSDRDWVWTGGYLYLHQNVPVYSFDYPSPTEFPPQFLILPTGITPKDYEVVKTLAPYLQPSLGQVNQHPGYTLFRSTEPCHSPPSIGYTRSFSYLNPILDSIEPLYDP